MSVVVGILRFYCLLAEQLKQIIHNIPLLLSAPSAALCVCSSSSSMFAGIRVIGLLGLSSSPSDGMETTSATHQVSSRERHKGTECYRSTMSLYRKICYNWIHVRANVIMKQIRQLSSSSMLHSKQRWNSNKLQGIIVQKDIHFIESCKNFTCSKLCLKA
jgi:hypothetical protein